MGSSKGTIETNWGRSCKLKIKGWCRISSKTSFRLEGNSSRPKRGPQSPTTAVRLLFFILLLLFSLYSNLSCNITSISPAILHQSLLLPYTILLNPTPSQFQTIREQRRLFEQEMSSSSWRRQWTTVIERNWFYCLRIFLIRREPNNYLLCRLYVYLCVCVNGVILVLLRVS